MEPDVQFLMSKYCWRHTPYDHQVSAFEISKNRRAFAYFAEMGTGKSLMVLMNATYLYVEGKIDALVIVAPGGMYRNWESEINEHLTNEFPRKIAVWSSAAKKDEKKALANLRAGEKVLRILLMNIEAFVSDKALEYIFDFTKDHRTMMVIDESTLIKSPTAKRTKVAINLGKFAIYRRLCSGNPVPNGLLDIHSQSEFLEHNILGYGNYFAFRNRFAVMQEMKLGSHSFKRIVGFRDTEKVQQLMRQFSFIIKKSDCLDLPKKVYQVIDVQLGPLQAKAYESMTQDAFVSLDGGGQVSAQMVITQLIRLHQISCGFLKPDHEDEVPFAEPNPRIEIMLDILSQVPRKAIVWATYRKNIRQIIDAISEKFGKESVAEYYGDTSQEKRKEAKISFQDPNSPVKFIVSNPDTGRFGNTWTQADTVIYFSNSYNLESREQSEDRAHRISQTGMIHGDDTEPSVLYIDLVARGTVDERILKVLKGKKKLTEEIVQSNWRWLLGLEAKA